MYINRPAYNYKHLKFLSNSICSGGKQKYRIAEIGAGTGKLTKMLAKIGFKVFAVEPNDAMRTEGKKYTNDFDVIWSKGTGEDTGLSSNYFDWAIMASSFHWTNPDLSVPEFYRILKSKRFLSIIWNPRNVQSSKLHTDIEKIIYHEIPNLDRKSSGMKSQTKNWENILTKSNQFGNVIYSEISYKQPVSKDRYIKAWKSVNDIRVQAGEKRFNLIIKKIQTKISDIDDFTVPYLNTCWTAQKIN